MAGKNKKKKTSGNVVAQNRRARRDYNILETVEAGLQLTGTEVKSLRAGRASLNEAFAGEKHGEMYLFNAHIPPYEGASRVFNHEPVHDRKLLLHRKQMSHLLGSQKQKGMALIPLKIYFNARGMAKLELGLGEGKHTYDKRDTVKQRDWSREKGRLLRDKG
ncbi:SsrA-binding protein SmpB [Thalassospiraceae bacterium LMO-JJ14]|nr:SsrA-binding protein SmpB [Thalassospiraceae bacterium LMO-JJ14]